MEWMEQAFSVPSRCHSWQSSSSRWSEYVTRQCPHIRTLHRFWPSRRPSRTGWDRHGGWKYLGDTYIVAWSSRMDRMIFRHEHTRSFRKRLYLSSRLILPLLLLRNLLPLHSGTSSQVLLLGSRSLQFLDTEVSSFLQQACIKCVVKPSISLPEYWKDSTA